MAMILQYYLQLQLFVDIIIVETLELDAFA